MKQQINQPACQKIITLLCSFLFSCSAHATDPVHSAKTSTEDNTIKVGMSASYTGAAAQSGKNLDLGISIYFDRINAEGGINGHKLKFISLDDGYEPLRAIDNLHQLIDKEKVISIIGNNGTSAAVVAVPIMNENKILLFGSRSGSDLLRKAPPDRYIINLRASYYDETNALIKGILTSGIKPENIAFFIQNDAFGDSIYQAAMKSLKAEGFNHPESLPLGRYDRNTLNVTPAFTSIKKNAKYPIKAFIVGGVYRSNAQFIKLAKAEYPDAIFLAVSGLIDPADLDSSLNNKVISSQVVPDVNSNLPAIVEYREDLIKYGHAQEPNPASLEGYLVAKMLVFVLKKAIEKNMLSREGIITVFEDMKNVDVGIGVKFNYSKSNHNGLSTVWMSIFNNGKFIPTDWPNIPAKQHK